MHDLHHSYTFTTSHIDLTPLDQSRKARRFGFCALKRKFRLTTTPKKRKANWTTLVQGRAGLA